jgi:hypothetical protein
VKEQNVSVIEPPPVAQERHAPTWLIPMAWALTIACFVLHLTSRDRFPVLSDRI